jgi:hypothetical protein
MSRAPLCVRAAHDLHFDARSRDFAELFAQCHPDHGGLVISPSSVVRRPAPRYDYRPDSGAPAQLATRSKTN